MSGRTAFIASTLGALLCAVFLLTGCASDPKSGDARKLETTLSAYHSALRWHGVEQALAMHDPEVLKEHAPTPFEIEHWKQFRIVGYREGTAVPDGEGRVQQRVAIELVNVNTQSVRNLVDVQEWRYDAEAKRWWLTSGLPDLGAR